MLNEKGQGTQNIVQYVLVVLVIITLVGSWMAYAQAGTAKGASKEEVQSIVSSAQEEIIGAIGDGDGDGQVTRADVTNYISTEIGDWEGAKTLLQDAGITIPDTGELEIRVGLLHEVPKGTGAYADFESNRVLEMENYFDWLEVQNEYDVAAADAPSVAESLITDFGADIVFTHFQPIGNSFLNTDEEGYGGLATEYPNVLFCVEAFGDPPRPEVASNVVRYMPGTYYGMYLMGMVAGAYADTQNNRVGFINSQPLNLSKRRLNAYVLGAQEVNPDVEIYNTYLGTWFDPAQESQGTRRLIQDYDVQVVCKVTDSASPNEVAANNEVYYQAQGGNPPALDKGDPRWHAGSTPASNEVLILDLINHYVTGWEKNYMKPIQWRRMEPRPAWEPGADFFHNADLVNGNKVGMDAINDQIMDALSQETIDLIQKRREQMIEGAWDPFMGEVVDADGNVRSEYGETFTVQELIEMDWHVQGITEA